MGDREILHIEMTKDSNLGKLWRCIKPFAQIQERTLTYDYCSTLSGQIIRLLRNWTAAPACGYIRFDMVLMPFRQPGP